MKEDAKRERGKGVKPVSGRRIDFLGYSFSRENVRLRKSIKRHFAQKVKNLKSETRRKQVLASYWGWCKWGNCRNLWNSITNNYMGFASKGIVPSGTTKDGKKYYEVRKVSISDILNVPITIVDFETGVKTTKGTDRYAVLFENRTGERFKFITTAFNLKNVLDQARLAEKDGRKIFPVDNVVIRRRSFDDGKSTYYFDENN